MLCSGIALGYIVGDVYYIGYLERQKGHPDKVVNRAMVQEFLFQMIASLLVPTVIIHTAGEFAVFQDRCLSHRVCCSS